LAVIKYPVFGSKLNYLRSRGLMREIRDRSSPQESIVTINGKECLNFSSNDYLGLANDSRLIRAAEEAIRTYGAGAGAARLLGGGCSLHEELEKKVADFKDTEAAMLFNSGYSANTGIIPAISEEDDALLSDELNHASLIDGCRLSRAKTSVYRHRDMGHLESLLKQSKARKKIVITDSVFSMDGNIAPLDDICALCHKYGALLYIDDAHGTGVLGKGRGGLAHFGIAPESWIIQMGTFSKALGSLGAFSASCKETIDWLINSARSFIFSTALPPAVVAASLEAINLITNDTGPINRLWANRERLFDLLSELGIDTGGTETPIVPILMDKVEDALDLSSRLFDNGIYAPAIRPPVVDIPRLRLTVTAAHTTEDLAYLADKLKTMLRG
jgi:8-amino-7-oxononanoate synthase